MKILATDPSGSVGQCLVDFIVISKNQLHFTKQCVESLFANVTVPSHLIWVDNASDDGTREYL